MDANLTVKIVSGVILCLLGVAALSDWRSRTVPDILPVLIFSIASAAIILLPDLRDEALSRSGALVIMIVAGTLLGGIKILGGGDIKLLAALAPWYGLSVLPYALLLIGVVGGVLASGFIVRHALAGDGWRAGLKSRVPYAVAIFVAEAARLAGSAQF